MRACVIGNPIREKAGANAWVFLCTRHKTHIWVVLGSSHCLDSANLFYPVPAPQQYRYRAPDFERFKADVIDEARSAGYRCPQSQYNHIRSKYLDDVTARNTELNLRRTSADAPATDDDDCSGDSTSSGCSTPLLSRPAVPASSKQHQQQSSRPKKGHRRSVSWSKELQQVLAEPAPPRSVSLTSAQPSVAAPQQQPRRLSARDEAAQILDEEDSPELKDIFL